MSRTKKDQPWWVKVKGGFRMRKCPDRNCLWCQRGPEGKALARTARRQEGKRQIEEGQA